jgi:diphosphomevalonate decarboxylase
VLLTTAAFVDAVESLARSVGAREVVRCAPGGDARLIDSHLF